MVTLRRLSSKKTRFSCRKLAYSELCRFQHLEYTRALTWRKRAEKILFLPEVKDEVKQLSSESVQRILAQGSPFHFSRTLEREAEDSLHTKLFGGLLSARRLRNHDLVLLISLLRKLSAANVPLLYRALEECLTRFNSFMLSEIAHVSYITTSLLEPIKDSFCQRWITKLVSLLRRTDLASLHPSDFSSIAKLTYTLSHNLPQQHDLLLKLISALPPAEKYDAKVFSRDCSLLCRGMLKTGIVNYDFLREASDFHQMALSQHVDALTLRIRERTIMSGGKMVFSLNEPLDSHVRVPDVLALLEAYEHFGYHNKELMSTFNRYVESTLAYFTSDPRVPDLYRRKPVNSTHLVTRKYIELLEIQAYKRSTTGKNDLQKLLKDLIASIPRDPEEIWSIETTFTIGNRYNVNRKLFASFLHILFSNIQMETITAKQREMLQELCRTHLRFHPKLFSHLTLNTKNDLAISGARINESNPGTSFAIVGSQSKTWFTHGQSFEELCEMYIKEQKNEQLLAIKESFEAMGSYLPRITCWNGIWKMFRVITVSGSMDMLPLIHSFLEESFLGFQLLDCPIEDACSICLTLLTGTKLSSSELLCLHSCVRVIELLLTSELSRDYAKLETFANVLELSAAVKCHLDEWKDHSDDVKYLVQQLSSVLLRFLKGFSKAKTEIITIPVEKDVHYKVQRCITRLFTQSRELEPFTPEKTLELLRRAKGYQNFEFLAANTNLIRHIILDGHYQSNT